MVFDILRMEEKGLEEAVSRVLGFYIVNNFECSKG